MTEQQLLLLQSFRAHMQLKERGLWDMQQVSLALLQPSVALIRYACQQGPASEH